MSFRIDATKGLTGNQIHDAFVNYFNVNGLDKSCSYFGYTRDIVINHKLEYGENLYLRGQGFSVTVNGREQEANWDRGILLQNTGSDTWAARITLHNTDAVFKALINDDNKRWEEGENHTCIDFFRLMQKTHSYFSMSLKT